MQKKQMKLETYVYKDQKKLRCGYTTGSCSAAAAKAAVAMLLTGKKVETVSLLTPKGIKLQLLVENVCLSEKRAACGIRKDAGDDADVTNGILIMAEAEKRDEPGVFLTGGQGIGRVTKPGLEQQPGCYAINRIPRQMIREAAESVMEENGYEGGISIVISAPEGERIAAKTFNPSLGIEGGISILGTSGIVEPMSEKALVDTIALEMQMHEARGESYCIITPGNYGMHFIRQTLKLDLKKTVKCSNFIGDTIDMAPVYHMKGLLLVGHLGKLVKLGVGIMNTHSRYADGRMEVLAACALEAGADTGLLREIMNCVTTDEAVAVCKEAGLSEQVMAILMKKIEFHLKKRIYEGIRIGAVVFSNQYGLLGMTEEAEWLLPVIRERSEKEAEHRK